MTGKQFREAVGGLKKILDPKTGKEKDTVHNMKVFREV